MKPDEEKMQREKIHLMKLALVLGGVWALFVIAALFQLIKNTAK